MPRTVDCDDGADAPPPESVRPAAPIARDEATGLGVWQTVAVRQVDDAAEASAEAHRRENADAARDKRDRQRREATGSIDDRARQIFDSAKASLKDRAEGTRIQGPTETFEDKKVIEMGDFRIEVLHLGPAHSPGDIQVWLPEQSLVIAGDMAFHERLLPIFDETGTKAWVETWEGPFEALNATYVIPGHGHPTNMAQVRRYTHDYLVYLRGKIAEHLEKGGGLDDAYYVDQSPYKHLDTFDELATRNAGRVFVQMEFE